MLYIFTVVCLIVRQPLFPFQVLGGIEPSLYKGEIWYTPVEKEWYYQVEILKLEVGGENLNLDCKEVFIARKHNLIFLHSGVANMALVEALGWWVQKPLKWS